MKIYSVALNLHDQNTYDGVYHNQRERHTRFKHNLAYYADAYVHQSDILNTNDYRLNKEFVEEYWKKKDDVLAFTWTQGGIRMMRADMNKEFLDFTPKKLFDYVMKDNVYYIDHQSHALYVLNSGFDISDIVAIDGIGVSLDVYLLIKIKI